MFNYRRLGIVLVALLACGLALSFGAKWWDSYKAERDAREYYAQLEGKLTAQDEEMTRLCEELGWAESNLKMEKALSEELRLAWKASAEENKGLMKRIKQAKLDIDRISRANVVLSEQLQGFRTSVSGNKEYRAIKGDPIWFNFFDPDIFVPDNEVLDLSLFLDVHVLGLKQRPKDGVLEFEAMRVYHVDAKGKKITDKPAEVLSYSYDYTVPPPAKKKWYEHFSLYVQGEANAPFYGDLWEGVNIRALGGLEIYGAYAQAGFLLDPNPIERSAPFWSVGYRKSW
jgi:hypothetical protein